MERFRSPCRIDAITILMCFGGEIDCSINLKHYHICHDTLLINLPDDILQIHQATAVDAYAVVISSALLDSPTSQGGSHRATWFVAYGIPCVQD